MSDTKNPKDDPLVTKDDNPDPVYQRLMAAYADNPFHDITKDEIAEFARKAAEEQAKKDAEKPVEIV